MGRARVRGRRPAGVDLQRSLRERVVERPQADGRVAIVHTHPLRTDPRPSSGDAALSRRLGLPVYTLTRYGLWVAQPDGTIRLEAPAPATCTHLACVPWRTGKPHPAESAETGASNPAL